jgi:hypothetical protein
LARDADERERAAVGRAEPPRADPERDDFVPEAMA